MVMCESVNALVNVKDEETYSHGIKINTELDISASCHTHFV